MQEKYNTKSRIFLLIGRDFPIFNVQIHKEISNRIKNQFDGVNMGQAYSLLLPFVMSKHDKSTFDIRNLEGCQNITLV